jgi:hypothetical protein
MVAHFEGQADLRLPHPFSAAFAPAVQKENDGPLFVVIAAEIFWKVDLESIGLAMQFNAAIEEPGLLRRVDVRLRFPCQRLGRQKMSPKNEANRQESKESQHVLSNISGPMTKVSLDFVPGMVLFDFP